MLNLMVYINENINKVNDINIRKGTFKKSKVLKASHLALQSSKHWSLFQGSDCHFLEPELHLQLIPGLHI